MSDEKEIVRWYKSPNSVVGIIFLGAIGSGVWELFLKDALTSAFVMFSSAIGLVSSGYLDAIHEDIGKANTNEVGVYLFLFLMLMIVFLNILGARFVLRTYKKLKSETPSRPASITPKKAKRMVILVGLMSVFNVIAYSEATFTNLYRIRAVTWTERSIEIVRPNISELEFLKLRAQYRSVASAQAFYALIHALRDYASRTKTTLPEFSAIGDSAET